ncbi:GNAT family N-acetyltransferase [Geobacter grbiciae]|uniref:GNAT family N-acetyltransferase n=1 Tax=Geobacter grbiciae TaxID=155042 RepID=UPI001C01F081|nr:GNAT family N-acetyltransferase [Geobacter grbiciae]MBT1075310.1 GNAT family N-acetyltransferase [Geobacter grbiciae]
MDWGKYKLELCTGPAVIPHLSEIARLRITIFGEYPYLYKGSREIETKYLRAYADTPDACVFVARDGDAIIGAGTGVPLRGEPATFTAPFADSPFSLDTIYYLGEVLFLPGYRGQGLGSRLLKEFEEHIHSLGRYRHLACATIERPEDHPPRPDDYHPIDGYLTRAGFTRYPELRVTLPWPDLEGEVTDNTMVFWMKELFVPPSAFTP